MTDYEGVETYTCSRHGITFPCVKPSEARERAWPVGCPSCTEEVRSGLAPATMMGEERATEVTRLLTKPATAEFQAIHERISALVGRDVWTHEIVNPGALAAEARDWKHPGDLRGHLLGSLRDAMGDKPVVVIETPKRVTE